MAKKEAKTDLWVHGLLKEAGIELEPQGSTIVEIDKALKTASKSGSGNVGFPEFVGVVKDFILVIENKADLANHIKLDSKGVISTTPKDTKGFAVNGAWFYGKHLAENTSYKKVIAFGISGDEKKHRISPIYVDETEYYRELPEVESFITFTEDNIEEYYIKEILEEETDKDKELSEILRDAAELHEDLRNYGNLKDIDKPLIVSGILLALREAESKNFSIEDLTGDDINPDGDKIYNAIEANLKRSRVSPEVKRDKILSQFSIIKDTHILNEVNKSLKKTPIKHFTEYLYDKIYRSIKYTSSSEDYLGRFYGEFMSYSGGDGQTLGIVLTPKHITDLFCDLVEIHPDDIVLDPCAGTGGFLISAMHHMLSQADSERQKKNIRQKQLHGLELQPYMFTIATTNMILRGDGKSNLINNNFLNENPNKLQLKEANVGMMNPPYSQGSKKNPDLYEIAFTEHLLDSLTVGAKAIVIIPQSSVTGKTKEEQSIKRNILKKHTLEGVITLNKDTFYGVGTMPCIAIFTAGEAHTNTDECRFIDFRDDGFKISPHIGLIETEQAKDKKQHLLDVWFERISAATKFCVKTTVKPEDEWLHSFYYFNDEIPSEEEIEKTVGDFLSFEFSMVMKGRDYLFKQSSPLDTKRQPKLDAQVWKPFKLDELFDVGKGIYLNKKNITKGNNPYVTASALNNGVSDFISNPILFPKNTITIEKVKLSAFYQPHEFYCSHDVSCINHKKINRYSGLFIAAMINRQGGKYSYGRQAQLNVVKRETVYLPVDKKEEPNWNFMEKFVYCLEKKKRKAYQRILIES
ncbi:N-6 DNA methylase [Pseudocolwellia sp. HL-MZ7]|uniref:N-6 DNA methylase n=1 Tax=Pseudocolwellia sp. HL-MZ7 TaxID=3400627 RepID=UPI003CF18CC4